MNKLWLCGMVRGQREILEQTVAPVMPYFDGSILVVDSRAKSEDVDWLNSIKKDGEIIVKRWVRDHSHTSNEVLFSEKLKTGDIIVWIDETDKLQESFVSRLCNDMKYLASQGVGAIWLDHPFVFFWNDGLRFKNSPHWYVDGIIGKIVHLPSNPSYKKEDYLINLRDNDKLRSCFISPIKYFFEYPNFSNHSELLYRQFSTEIWKQREEARVEFRIYCEQALKIKMTVDGLKEYLVNNVSKYPEKFEKMIEDEVNLKDAFRLFVLNQPWEQLAKLRFDWSYFHWKTTGEIIQDQTKTGYRGLFNIFKLAKGETPE